MKVFPNIWDSPPYALNRSLAAYRRLAGRLGLVLRETKDLGERIFAPLTSQHQPAHQNLSM